MPKEVKKKKVKLIIKAPKGTKDILPQEAYLWDEVLGRVFSTAEAYSFSRIETPILESLEVFERSLGEATDIVEKQMFSVKGKGSENLVLRPEGTASVMRAYIENGLDHTPQPAKLYYHGPMFRYEQPQAGRFRQFYQAGFEIIGAESDPIYDAQIIIVMNRFLEQLKITNLITEINSLGCKSCRLNYKKKLVGYY
jgi:histidyl-tRNA synthetase